MTTKHESPNTHHRQAGIRIKACCHVLVHSTLRVPSAGRKYNRESGFTLVEIAMVLMVIGLLFGGIVRGQELINSTKTRNLAQEFRAVQTALYSYQDRYKALPGDNRAAATADARAIVASTPAGLIGNGRIDGAWDSSIDSDESRLVWQQLRVAGFLAGPTQLSDPDYIPRTQFGTKMGISSNMQVTAPTLPNGQYNICTSGIPGKFAKHLDAQIDDGNAQTGAVRIARTSAPGIALQTSEIDDAEGYLLCFSF